MRKLTRGSRGFTLVELMVVVAILAVLMSIVMPAITGTKSQSTEGQVQSDGKSTQTATDNFNNRSIKSGQFPEVSLASVFAATTELTGKNKYNDVLKVGAIAPLSGGLNVTLVLKDGTSEALSTTIEKPGTGVFVSKRTIINLDATTDVYDADGSVKKVTFVPDFLSKDPASLPLKGDETKDLGASANTYEEYIWLNLVNAPGSSQESRNVEVYRMTAATVVGTAVHALTYTQIF